MNKTSLVPGNKVESLTDSQLITNIVKHSCEVSSTELYNRHIHTVKAVLLQRSRHTDVEDMTQDVFTQVFKMLHTFKGEARFSTWLYRVTINTWLMTTRRKNGKLRGGNVKGGSKKADVPEMFLSLENDESESQRYYLATHDEFLESVPAKVTVEKLMDALTPHKKEFVILKMLGYEHTEIAELKGCSTGNSKAMLARSIAKMQQKHERLERRSLIIRSRREVNGTTRDECI